jgi:hypothetical protein
MNTKLMLLALCAAPLMACAGFDAEGMDGFDGEEEEIGTAEQALTCVTPPAVSLSAALSTGGDVGNNTSFTSPSNSYYPGYYVTEVTGTSMPNQSAAASNTELTGSCSSNKVQAEFYCFNTTVNCWVQCGVNTISSGVLTSFFDGQICTAAAGITVPSNTSRVRIKARAFNSANTSVGKRVTEEVSWHY